MNLKNVLKEIITTIDSSEKTNKVLTFFQMLATASIGICTIYTGSQKDIARWSSYTFWFFQLIVLLYFLSMFVISGKFRAIKLRLNKNTGVLYDTTTFFRNVSIRDETFNIILDGIGDHEKAYKIGKKSGENFYSAYEGVLQRKGKEYNAKKQLEKWMEYDSSSGIGKFEILQDDLLIKFKITSPFVGTCPNQSLNPRCNFLLGYIEGFCSKLYEKEFNIECEHNSNPPFCILILKPAT